jgi:O-antigen/teichoic acid export membrane protein
VPRDPWRARLRVAVDVGAQESFCREAGTVGPIGRSVRRRGSGAAGAILPAGSRVCRRFIDDHSQHISYSILNKPHSSPPAPGFLESIRTMIAWSVIGQIVYVLCQLAVVISLARFGTVEDVGRFGLSTAITGPVFFFFSLGLRYNLATDSGSSFGFSTFLAVRLVGALGGLLTVAAIAALTIRDPLTLTILGLFSLAKAVDLYSDLMYGVFQKHGRLRWVATSQMLRGVFGAVLFGGIMIVDGSPGLAFLTFFGVWLAVLLLHDLPRAFALEGRAHRMAPLSEIWRLIWNSAPLGAAGLFAQISAATPRLVLANLAGLEALGYFTSVAYFFQAANMLVQSITHAIIGRLARYWADGKRREFWSLVLRISAILSGLVFVATLAAIPLGGPVLALLFGEDYRPYGILLVLMMLALAINIPAPVLETGLMAQRRFQAQLVNRIIFAGLVVISCSTAVFIYGLNGAAIGYAVAAAVHLPIILFILRRAAWPSAAA